ncbi:MAG: ABC transporter permease [Verrucomicrobiales bacterium]|nr:ABC transporter permease [Verrucomicrobiales bacterium]
MSDLRIALRRLVGSPTFTLVAILSIAAGIGANAVVFTWIRTTLLHAIPGVPRPAELAVVCPRHISGELTDTMSLPDLHALAAETNLFAGVTGSQMGVTTLRIGETTEWIWGQMTLANFFDVLEVRPWIGRGFEAGSDRPGAAGNEAVISHALWQRRFGGRPDILGTSVEINRRPVTIVGVAPPEFQGTMGSLRFDVWVPITVQIEPEELRRRETRTGWRWIHTVARLAPGSGFGRTATATAALGNRLAREHPAESRDLTFDLLHVWESPWGGQALFLPLLRALAAVALLLLVLVTANVANLLLARAQGRRTEMALRLALGAAPGRVLRQLLVESLVLAAAGGIPGVLAAAWGSHALGSLLPPTYLPVALEFPLDWTVVAASGLLTALAGIGFGLVPAWQAARTDLNATLKSGSRAAAGGERAPLRSAFVIGQLALALTLLVGMGLCIRSLAAARHLDVGLQPRDVFVAGFRLSPGWGTDAEAQQFYRRLRSAAEAIPGVDAVAVADWLPLGFEGGSSIGVKVQGYEPRPGETMSAGVATVSPGYWDALRIPFLSGRGFRDSDDASAPPVVVINEELARRWFPGREPIGLKLQISGRETTVIGVVKTGRYRALGEPPQPFLYRCQEQMRDRDLTLVVRHHGSTEVLRTALEQASTHLDPTVRPFATMPYETFLEAAFMVPRSAAVLFSLLGALALILASLGVYGVMSQNVSARTREIGVRMALGAAPQDVLRLMFSHGLKLAAGGLLFGGAMAFGASRVLESLLIGVRAGDVATWILCPLLLLTAALSACLIPALRAARVQPMAALRGEG